MDNGAAVIYWFNTGKKWHALTNCETKSMCGNINEHNKKYYQGESKKSPFDFVRKFNNDNTVPTCKTCKRAVRTLNRAMSACCC